MPQFSKAQLGTTPITKAYLGSTLVLAAVAAVEDFEAVLSTVGAASTVALLPLSGGTVTIDWGDGTVVADYALAGGAPTHDYGSSGQWTVIVTGTATRLGSTLDARWQQTVQTVRSWHGLGLTSMQNAFRGCTRAVSVPATLPSSVTNMSFMFDQAAAANPDVSGWNTSQVTTMTFMFRQASVANPDVSGWDTSQVTTMAYMFDEAAAANPDVSGWDTSQVTTMRHTFVKAYVANPDVSGWDTSQVADMSLMFWQAYVANPNVALWSIPLVTDMANFADGSAFSNVNYDAALVNFSGQTVQSSVAFHAGTAKYTQTAARDDLINNDLWTITDGGAA